MPINPASVAGGLVQADAGAWPAGMALAAPTAFPPDEVYTPFEDNAPPGMPVFDTVIADPVMRHFGASYGLLDRSRPEAASLARFAHRVEVASFYMCAAFEQGGVRDFALDAGASQRPRRGASWFSSIADTTFCRFEVLRRALKHDWTPPAEVEPLTYSAFHSLCDVIPSSAHNLKQLYLSQREDAIASLVHQLELTAKLLEEAVSLASQSSAVLHDRAAEDDAARLASIQAEILSTAGETLGLREAAARLGTSHQALHKRIRTGSALGVMHGRELLVPTVQFVADGKGVKIVPELKRILTLFEQSGAGLWSALQFLTDHDPLLGAVPIERLKSGDVDRSVHAARGFLGLDES